MYVSRYESPNIINTDKDSIDSQWLFAFCHADLSIYFICGKNNWRLWSINPKMSQSIAEHASFII